MNLIGRERQLIIRALLIILSSCLVALYLLFFGPTEARCTAGSERVCATLAVKNHLKYFSPIANLDRETITFRWVDGHFHRVPAAELWPGLVELAMPSIWKHVGISLAILFSGIASGYIIPSLLLRHGERGKKHKRGAKVESARALARLTKRQKPGGLSIGDVPIPQSLEPLSFRFAGSPGSGKSQAINRLVWQFRRRGDPAVIADAGGELMAQLSLSRDVLLNPFDQRSVHWSPFSEIQGPADTIRLVKSLIPDAEGDRGSWHRYAQQVLQVTVDRLRQTGRGTNGWLTYFCCAASNDEWAELVQNSPASRWFEAANERAFGSIAGVISSHITPLSYLPPEAGEDSFSITKWVSTARENESVLWLPYRSDSRAAVATMIASWVDIATTSLMTLGSDRARRMFLVVDELAALGKINSLPDALAQGRKFGLVGVAGYQTEAQLRDTYGRETCKTLLACLQNKVVLSTADYESAEALAKDLGEAEVAREEHSSSGKIGDAASHTRREQRTIEKVILASEIQGLKPLSGFIKLAGEYPVARIELEPIEFLRRAEPFIPLAEFFPEIRRPDDPPADASTPDQVEPTPTPDAPELDDGDEDEIDDADLLETLNDELQSELAELEDLDAEGDEVDEETPKC